MDVQVGYPIDWFLFGKRAAAMASARQGVRQSEADYADLVRQRVTDDRDGLLRCRGGEVPARPGPPGHRQPDPT